MAQSAAGILDRIAHIVQHGRNLTASAQQVLLALLGYADETGAAWPSTETLARVTGRNPRTIRRALVELHGAGLLRTRQRPGASCVRSVVPRAIPGEIASLHRPSPRRAVGEGAPGMRPVCVATPSPSPVAQVAQHAPNPLDGGRAQVSGGGGRTRPPITPRDHTTKDRLKSDARNRPHSQQPPQRRRHSPSHRDRKPFSLGGLSAALLDAPARLLEAIGAGKVLSDSQRLRALAAAHVARQRARINPVGLFVHLVLGRGEIPLEFEDRARRDLMDLDGRAPDPRPRRSAQVEVSPTCRINRPAERVDPAHISECLAGFRAAIAG